MSTLIPPQTPPASPAPEVTSRDPLHGITLEQMLTELVAQLGWEEMGGSLPIRCFTSDPSISSSLKFLRKTPWARTRVEGMYLHMTRKRERREASASR